MSTDRGKPVDFDIIDEPWLKYQLQDNTVLKTRYLLTRLYKKMQDGKATYNFDGQTMTIALVPSDLIGPKDNARYSPQELSNSVIRDEVNYKTISEDWNEYYAYDGAKVRLKMTVTGVKKTSKFDNNGEPIYLVENNAMVQVRPPKLD